MEIEANEMLNASAEKLIRSMEKLNGAASLLERMVARLEEREAAVTGEVQKIVAEVERGEDSSERELELERRLAQAEQQIAEMRAQDSKAVSARKTLPATTAQLLAKQGITSVDSIEAGALDAALTGLSLEQRIAVKAQLLRAGVLS
jgi:DNA-binding Lrp family transcriptional regulator